MRLIILVGLIVLTFVFGFLFAHEPFRNAVIKKTVHEFFSDDDAPKAPPAPSNRKERRDSERLARHSASPTGTPGQEDQITERDRRQLDDLISKKLAQDKR